MSKEADITHRDSIARGTFVLSAAVKMMCAAILYVVGVCLNSSSTVRNTNILFHKDFSRWKSDVALQHSKCRYFRICASIDRSLCGGNTAAAHQARLCVGARSQNRQ